MKNLKPFFKPRFYQHWYIVRYWLGRRRHAYNSRHRLLRRLGLQAVTSSSTAPFSAHSLFRLAISRCQRTKRKPVIQLSILDGNCSLQTLKTKKILTAPLFTGSRGLVVQTSFTIKLCMMQAAGYNHVMYTSYTCTRKVQTPIHTRSTTCGIYLDLSNS